MNCEFKSQVFESDYTRKKALSLHGLGIWVKKRFPGSLVFSLQKTSVEMFCFFVPCADFRNVRATWNLKHLFINGCFNWMIPNLYIGNGWK